MKKIFFLCTAAALLLWCAQAFALSVDEIVHLKQNGIADETIQLMLQLESEDRRAQQRSIQITETSTAVRYSTGKPSETDLPRRERQNLKRAWDMLKNMRLELER